MNNDIKTIIFISPKDIKKNEEFTFGELFSVDENIQKLEEANKNLISNKAEISLKVIEEELRNKYNEKEILLKNSLDKSKEEMEKNISFLKQEMEKQFKDKEEFLVQKVEINEKEKTQSLHSEISALKAEREKLKEINESYKETIEEKRGVFDDLKEKYIDIQDSKLNIQAKEFGKEKEDLIKYYEDLNKNAKSIGDVAENDIRETLKTIFEHDDITKPNASLGGADILHKIKDKDVEISSIYYEIKNRSTWTRADYQNFADKVMNEKYDFYIYIAKSLPKGTAKNMQQLKIIEEGKLLYDEINNIYLTSLDNWLPIVFAIRKQAVEISKLKEEKGNKTTIQQQVFDFFKSSEFSNYFTRMLKNIQESDKYFNEIQNSSIKGKGEILKIQNEVESLKLITEIKFQIDKDDK